MRRRMMAVGAVIGVVTLSPAVSAQTIEKRVRVGPLGKALLSVRSDPPRRDVAPRLDARPATMAGKARVAMLTETGDQFGLGLSRSRRSESRTVSAVVGLWSDERSIEFGAFQDRSNAGTARTVQQVTGRRMETRGVRLTGSLYGTADDSARGWTVAVDARHQRLPDPADALRGDRDTDADSRVLVSGRLRF